MKVFLLKDVQKVGVEGEVVKVQDGFAVNFLLPRKLAIEITSNNEHAFKGRVKVIEQRKEVIATKTSMLSEKISSLKLTIKRKMHDDDKLYGSVSESEIVDLLAEKGIGISKNQVDFGKSIKAKGAYEVTIRLSSKLQPKFALNVVPEK